MARLYLSRDELLMVSVEYLDDDPRRFDMFEYESDKIDFTFETHYDLIRLNKEFLVKGENASETIDTYKFNGHEIRVNKQPEDQSPYLVVHFSVDGEEISVNEDLFDEYDEPGTLLTYALNGIVRSDEPYDGHDLSDKDVRRGMEFEDEMFEQLMEEDMEEDFSEDFEDR